MQAAGPDSRPHADVPPGHGPILRPGPRLSAAWTLSVTVLALMAVQAGLGLAVTGLYPEQTWAVAALRGNDLVTLVLVGPALGLALLASRRHATTASVLVWLGLLFYGAYNYAYYAFGTAFNDVFLLHVAAFSASVDSLDKSVLRPSPLAILKTECSLGRRMSASTISTFAPVCARLIAVFVAVVVFPSEGRLDVISKDFGAWPAVERSIDVRSCR